MNRFVVYCDESCHDGQGNRPFMGIGGLWVPTESRDHLHAQLKDVVNSAGLGAEMKWNKVSRAYLPAYRDVVDFFVRVPTLQFRIIIVQHSRVDYDRFHDGDAELGFYRFYYEMLVKWLAPNSEYLIILDHKTNRQPGRYGDLYRALRNSVNSTTTVKPLAIASSHESRLAQLADLLTGAVTAEWSGVRPGGAKAELIQYLAERTNRGSLRYASLSPALEKINVFNIRLS